MIFYGNRILTQFLITNHNVLLHTFCKRSVYAHLLFLSNLHRASFLEDKQCTDHNSYHKGQSVLGILHLMNPFQRFSLLQKYVIFFVYLLAE